jgi:hypothetical protein
MPELMEADVQPIEIADDPLDFGVGAVRVSKKGATIHDL